MSHLSKYKGAPVTTTDMGVECFANDAKLVDSDERIYFEHYRDENEKAAKYANYNEEDEGDGYHLDDEVEKYAKPSGSVFQTSRGLTDDQKPSRHGHSQMSDSATSAVDKSAKVDTSVDPDDESKWSKEELQLRKLDMLRKMVELQEAGVTLSQVYSLNSDYKTMKCEYDLHKSIRAKRTALSWMGNMMVGLVKGAEMLNDNFNPFDLKFDGTWSNEVKSDLSNYHDVLGEIYEKYTAPGKSMAPELKLFLMLTMSAVGIQMHKGVASVMAGSLSGPSNLDKNPDKFKEMREKAAEVNEKSKQKMNEKFQQEHSAAAKRMTDLNYIKQQQEEYEQMRQNAKPTEFYSGLQMSESATSRPSAVNRNRKSMANTFQMQKAVLAQQAQKTKMAKEMEELADMDRMISELKSESIRSEKSSKSGKSSKKKSESRASTAVSENDSSDASAATDTASSASTSVSFKNPNLSKILGGNIKQKEIVDKETAEATISLSNSQKAPARRGRPAKT